MVRSFESLECDGKAYFEWDRYDAYPPDQHQNYVVLKTYDRDFGMDLPFEIMISGCHPLSQSALNQYYSSLCMHGNVNK
jgi:hypothetical protein